jgi:hypothetical protein
VKDLLEGIRTSKFYFMGTYKKASALNKSKLATKCKIITATTIYKVVLELFMQQN